MGNTYVLAGAKRNQGVPDLRTAALIWSLHRGELDARLRIADTLAAHARAVLGEGDNFARDGRPAERKRLERALEADDPGTAARSTAWHEELARLGPDQPLPDPGAEAALQRASGSDHDAEAPHGEVALARAIGGASGAPGTEG